MIPENKPFYLSTKYYAAVIAFAVAILNHALGWNLSAEELTPILAPLLVYIVGQGLADFGKNKH